MIILGKNPDDKGKQLEQLTKYLLTQLGYVHIVTNEVGAGADEIDVTAEFRQPGLRNSIFHEVICECKAHKSPLNLPDWLKFLGKLYAKEHGASGTVQGCLIALNGVNGNVHGHFKNLNTQDGRLQIVEGDDLFSLLRQHLAILPIDQVLQQLRSMTTNSAVNTELVYYQSTCYWLVEFSDEVFSIFAADGTPLEGKHAQLISNLIQLNTGLREYIDLLAEKSARNRMLIIEKYVLSVMLMNVNPMSHKSIMSRKSFKYIRPQTGRINASEVNTAINTLTNAGVIEVFANGYILKTHLNGGTGADTIRFFKYFLEETVVLFALGSKQYRSLVDKSLLDEIAKIQGGLHLWPENELDYLNLLRWSPTALTWACYPDSFLTSHRKDGIPLNKQIEELGCSYFFQKLIDLFTVDYKNAGLMSYFLQKCGIVEIETDVNLRIKSNDKLLAEPHYNERLGLGQMGDEYNNVVVPVLMLQDQPEPWDRLITKTKSNG